MTIEKAILLATGACIVMAGIMIIIFMVWIGEYLDEMDKENK